MGNKPVKLLSASESKNISKVNKELKDTEKRRKQIDNNVNNCFYICMKYINRTTAKGETKTSFYVNIRDNIRSDVIEILKQKITTLGYSITLSFYEWDEYIVFISW